MAIRNLAVHLDEAVENDRLSLLAISLARALKAELMGVGTGRLKAMITGASLTLNLLQAQERELLQSLQQLEARFRAHARELPVEWRSAVLDDPTEFVLQQVVLADIIVFQHPSDGLFATDHLDAGRLVLGAGRPVLLLPPHTDTLEIDRALLAYKPSREGRAAVQAAIPLLRSASRVLIAGVGDEVSVSDLDDVAHYLKRHENTAEVRHLAKTDESICATLLGVAADDLSGLVVSGAYGHGRARERLFGGVTRDLLSSARLPCLLVH